MPTGKIPERRGPAFLGKPEGTNGSPATYRLRAKTGVKVVLGELDVHVHTLDQLVVFRSHKPLTASEAGTLTAAVAATGRVPVIVGPDVEMLELVPLEGGNGNG